VDAGRIVVDAPVREALARLAALGLDAGPPLAQLARAFDWQPLPLTIAEARPFADSLERGPPARGETAQAATGQPIIQIERLSYTYHGRPALKGVELTLAAGEAVALVGRNGAGKSTLLRCIVGLLPDYTGDVRLNGRPTRGRGVADLCREIGYLPQNPDDLLFAETVADELRTTLRNHRLPETVGTAELLRELGLDGLNDAYPRDLSVGQRQRVALGAVTVTRPRLLLLDEPTRGLDSATKATLVAIWRRWLAEGAAILLVTHDVELAATIAGRTVILNHGEVVAAGPTNEVLGNSPHFAPQIARLFPGAGWLTPADVLAHISARHSSSDKESEDASFDKNIHPAGG
jgi:energy-coupling factor transport system ATP-binding protein